LEKDKKDAIGVGEIRSAIFDCWVRASKASVRTSIIKEKYTQIL